MRQEPWYRRYNELRAAVDSKKDEFNQICIGLELDSADILNSFRRDIISRAVRESNWQEGLYLDPNRTRELVTIAFDQLPEIEGPHLDVDTYIDVHRHNVNGLKRKDVSLEELATYNLSVAHAALSYIYHELGTRQAASLAKALDGFREVYLKGWDKMPSETRVKIDKGFEILDKLAKDETKIKYPYSTIINTQGDLFKQLLDVDFNTLLNPMHSNYIHLLHRIVLMGMIPAKQLGKFRDIYVQVGDPLLIFPPPEAVPSMMEKYREEFPALLSTTKYDPILKAAEVSYKLVRIHPYADGNGRISRLIMNLVLFADFPPVYLKADKKGRHRYLQSLKRSATGNYEALGALIAQSLVTIYSRMISALALR